MNKYLSAIAAMTLGITILGYDAQFNTYARIKDGSIFKDLTRVYTNGQNGEFYKMSYDGAKFVLEKKYVPAYEAASKSAKGIGDMSFMQKSLDTYRSM